MSGYSKDTIYSLLIQNDYNVPIILREAYGSLPDTYPTFFAVLKDVFTDGIEPTKKASCLIALDAMNAFVVAIEMRIKLEEERIFNGLKNGRSLEELAGYKDDEDGNDDPETLAAYHRELLEQNELLNVLYSTLGVENWKISNVVQQVENFKNKRMFV